MVDWIFARPRHLSDDVMSPDNIFECSEHVYYKKEVKDGQNQPKCNKAIKFREKIWTFGHICYS